MDDTKIVRLNFLAASILAFCYLSVVSSSFFGLLLFGLPVLLLTTWVSGFADNAITEGSYLMAFISGCFVGLFGLVAGNISWFLRASLADSEAFGFALLIAISLSSFLAIPSAILGGMAGLSAKYFLSRKATD